MNPGKVCVAYLMRVETMSPSFHLSLVDLFISDLRNHARILGGGAHTADFCGPARIGEGRNQLVAQFLGSDAEWMFMVDDDMAFAPDVVDRLVEAADPVERPVVGGLCMAQRITHVDAAHIPHMQGFATLYRMATLDTETGFVPFDSWPEDELVQVAGTGAACLLIHRSVVEKIAEAHGPNWFTEVGHVGEDFAFCLRLTQADIPIFVHTGIRVGHHKSVHLVPPVAGGVVADGTAAPPVPA